MELTGKCKEEFEKWLLYCGVYGEYEYHLDEDLLSHFKNLKTSMQYGVYVDFFDSVGIYIEDKIDSCAKDFRYLATVNFKTKDAYNTRPEARIVAIEKANEIYNKI